MRALLVGSLFKPGSICGQSQLLRPVTVNISLRMNIHNTVNTANKLSNIQSEIPKKLKWHTGGYLYPHSRDIEGLKKETNPDLTSFESEIKNNLEHVKLFRHKDSITNELLITNDPGHYEEDKAPIKKILDEYGEQLKRVVDAFEKSKEDNKRIVNAFEEIKGDNKRIEDELEEIKDDNQRIEDELEKTKGSLAELLIERDLIYAAEVAKLPIRAAEIVLNKSEQMKRKEQIPNQFAKIIHDRNKLAHRISLRVALVHADTTPGKFDIFIEATFGMPKDLINRLIEWDKDYTYGVYKILSEHGTAWHLEYANECVYVFPRWSSAVVLLHEAQQLTKSNHPPSNIENRVQELENEVTESMKEWDTVYKADEGKWMAKRGKVAGDRKIIKMDYDMRKLTRPLREKLLDGVNLDSEEEVKGKKEIKTKGGRK